MDIWREFQGPNAGYVADLYEHYRRDPASVAPSARQLFERWAPPDGVSSASPAARRQLKHLSALARHHAGGLQTRSALTTRRRAVRHNLVWLRHLHQGGTRMTRLTARRLPTLLTPAAPPRQFGQSTAGRRLVTVLVQAGSNCCTRTVNVWT
jgi:hypothetical protein